MRKTRLIKIILYIVIFLITTFAVFNTQTTKCVDTIKSRGVLLIGTTGDYRPMSYFNPDTKKYEGFDIELSEDLAKALGVKLQFVPTSWPTLMQDTLAKKFDVAISGITITDARKKQALMSDGYLENGKTILCRIEDSKKYTDLQSVNKPEVKVMENPGGLNEEFVRKNLPQATLIIHNINQEIPNLIAEGKADVMITEVAEAKYYSKINKKLSAPVSDRPFTNAEIGILMPKENKDLLKFVNKFLEQERKNGRLKKLYNIYFL